MLGRVLHRALPNHYNATSVYTHFPLITPTGQPHSMDNVLRRNGALEKYSLERPVPQAPVQVITDVRSISAALSGDGPQAFITLYAQNIKDIKLDLGFLAVIDDTASYSKASTLLKQIVLPSSDALNRSLVWFRDRTLELIREKNLTLVDPSKHTIDLVKDIFRLVPVHWSSSQVVSWVADADGRP